MFRNKKWKTWLNVYYEVAVENLQFRFEYATIYLSEKGVCGVMVIVVGNEYGDSSSNPVCISDSTYTLGKGMNPNVLVPAMGKYHGRLGSLTLVGQLV